MSRGLASPVSTPSIEADTSGPILRRACSCGGTCSSCQEKMTIRSPIAGRRQGARRP